MTASLPREATESIQLARRNTLSKTVPRLASGRSWDRSESPHFHDGSRKYVNNAELRRVIAAAKSFDPSRSLFAQLLAFTGARVSEVLALNPASFQIEIGVVTIVTLKRRKHCLREIPIPPDLMQALDGHFGIVRAQQDIRSSGERLWRWGRTTAWRVIKKAMTLAGVVGRQACPRGLRHGFGVGVLQTGTALPIIQRWMGHSRLSTTAIYTNVCGPEEIAFAKRFWDNVSRKQPPRPSPNPHGLDHSHVVIGEFDCA